MTETPIRDFKDVLDAIDVVYRTFANQPWWRGHGKADWQLVPQVHRMKDRGKGYETNIAIKFSQRAPTRHPRCPPPGDLARWLFLMQHYRLPTRLLDWTESPLIALYFAVDDEDYRQSRGALWALDPFLMNELVTGDYGVFQPGHPQAEQLINLAFSGIPAAHDTVVALLTEEVDLRMMVQLSGVTIHGSPKPLEELENSDRFLLKFVLEPEAKDGIRTQLARFGIRERNLFPDLEHLAADLKEDVYHQ